VRAPEAGGDFSSRVNVQSNAQNYQGVLQVAIRGTVTPDYVLRPARHQLDAYPRKASPFDVEVAASAGRDPFTIAGVDGIAPFLEVVSKGSDEPASKQVVRLRVLPDAPTDPFRRQEIQARIRLAPSGAYLTWPISLLLLPSVYAEPRAVNFGQVPRGTAQKRSVHIATEGVVDFELVVAKAEYGKVLVTIMPKNQGMQPEVQVVLPADAPKGKFTDHIIIQTTHPDEKTIQIPVSGVVV
jgi:hypothetical protein